MVAWKEFLLTSLIAVSCEGLIFPYRYPSPSISFTDGVNSQSKVVVETVKSISPPEYLPPSGAFVSSNNVPGAKPGSVSFNAYQPPAPRQPTIVTAKAVTRPAVRRPGNLASFKYYNPGGGSGAAKTAPKVTPVASVTRPGTPASAAGAGTINIGAGSKSSTAAGGYNYNKPSSPANVGGSATLTGNTAAKTVTATTKAAPAVKSVATTASGGSTAGVTGSGATVTATGATATASGTSASGAVVTGAGATGTGTTAVTATAVTKPAAVVVKPKASGVPSPKSSGKSKTGQKILDSRPEESGFNGYSYNLPGFRGSGLGILGVSGGVSGGAGGGSGGMMGASYMRSRGTNYNYHVMLD